MDIVKSIILLVFPLAMVFAAISDLFTMKIRNNLVLALGATFFAAAYLMGMGWQDILLHVGAGAAVLVVSFSFFAFGWMGGGDAKFASATALWLGFGALLPYLVYASLFGGALTLVILYLRRFPLNEGLAAQEWISRLHNAKTGIPYGVALAIAGLIVFSSSPVFSGLIG